MFVSINYEDQVKAHNYALEVVREKRKYFNCSYESYFVGALGELAYSKVTKQEVNFDVYEGYKGDGGVDFPDGTDVKTSTWQSGGIQLKVSKKNPKKCKQYALCRVVHETMQHKTKMNFTNNIRVQIIGTINHKEFHKNKMSSSWGYDYVYEDKLTPLPQEIDANYPLATAS